jgi:hypothetical protein
MREIRLKELAAYLPYGLKVSKIHVLNIGKGIGSIPHILTTKRNDYKPILRPISEVENDIIYNGETVNVLGIMNGFWGIEWLGATEEFELHVYGRNIILSAEELPYDLVQVLLEHHFDVFGLISDNLAIPVTNEFNPYK